MRSLPAGRAVQGGAAKRQGGAREPRPDLASQPVVTHLRDLIPDPRNARRHTPKNIGMISDSLRAVGAGRSVVIDEDNVLLAGNGLVEAAAEAGITKVQVVDADGETIIAVRRTGLTPEQKTKLTLYDNRAAELAEWDADVLKAFAADGLDLAPYEFDAQFLEEIAGGPKAGLTDPDEVPAERATDIKVGDLFELGAHRLLCGDCTKAENVARLIGGEKAALVFTDPPYGVAYEGGRNPVSNAPRRKLTGDDAADLYLPCLTTTMAFCRDSAPWYLWFSGSHGMEAYAAAVAVGFTVRALIIWNKIDAHYGNFMAQYMQKHEPCLYLVRRPPVWNGPTNEVTVWDVKQPAKNELHPTQKPIELAIRALSNSSDVGAVVADWFAGSGTTLIACEQLGRIARAIEIEPSYCQVIIDRWEQFTGQKVVKVGEAVRA